MAPLAAPARNIRQVLTDSAQSRNSLEFAVKIQRSRSGDCLARTLRVFARTDRLARNVVVILMRSDPWSL